MTEINIENIYQNSRQSTSKTYRLVSSNTRGFSKRFRISDWTHQTNYYKCLFHEINQTGSNYAQWHTLEPSFTDISSGVTSKRLPVSSYFWSIPAPVSYRWSENLRCMMLVAERTVMMMIIMIWFDIAPQQQLYSSYIRLAAGTAINKCNKYN